jgi:chromosome segregation ATPase
MLVEAYMWGVAGLCLGLLIAVIGLPMVHDRSHRLTTERIEAATPALATEIQADKDHLRAQFAVVTRRLESNIENLKTRSGYLNAELSRREAENRRLRERLDDHVSRTVAVEARDRALRDQLRVAEEEVEYKATEMHAMQRDLAEKTGVFDKLKSELAETEQVAAQRFDELTSLKARLEALKARDILLLSVLGKPEQWYAPEPISSPDVVFQNAIETAEGPALVPPK